ncbi:thiamine pyrophosphate-binding protein [Paenibacillus sp. P25]|nr:thiamine pyrophosphate-binding protein [Paenibacillus sp. P25]
MILELGNQEIEYVLSRHETGAGYAAAGYALMNQTLGVSIGTSGPGGTNMVTAAGQAKAYHLPVLFLTGHAGAKVTGRPLGQDSTFFASDLVRMFEPVTLFSAMVERGDQLPVYLQHAFERAMYGVRGPVHLCIPYDVQTELTPPFTIPIPKHRYTTVSTMLQEAYDWMERAKNPVLFLGKGVHISGAYAEVRQLAEQWNIPVITTPGGKGSFVSQHPLHAGPYGLGGCPEARMVLESGIDLLIAVGTKLSDMSVPGFTDDMVPQRIIHFDVERTFVGKSFPSETLFIQGDAKRNIEELLALVPAEHKAASQPVRAERSHGGESSSGDAITAVEVMDVLGHTLPEDTLIFGDDGSHSYHAIRSLNIPRPGFFRFDDIFAAMGHAIGYSVGAQIAAPDRRIVALTGDGCMFMHGTEISTAVNQQAPVLFVVLNNGRLDMVNKGMKHHTGRADGTVYDVPLNVTAFAASMGARTFSARTKPEFEEVLREALLIRETIVIEVLVDPEEIPPTLARG